MSRALNDLDPRFQPIAFELIARCAEKGIALIVVDTLRTEAEQDWLIAHNRSWTKNSRHLPQMPSNKSLAMDCGIYEQYLLRGKDKLQWDTNDPAWQIYGEIAESLGLRWGGRWKQLDMGHVEYVLICIRCNLPIIGPYWWKNTMNEVGPIHDECFKKDTDNG